MIPRAETSPRSVSTTSRSPRSQTTVTCTGRYTGSANSRSYAAKYRGTASAAFTSADVASTASAKRMPGRSWMRLTVLSVSDGQRYCHAPPADGE
jgi:hypothetical protein